MNSFKIFGFLYRLSLVLTLVAALFRVGLLPCVALAGAAAVCRLVLVELTKTDPTRIGASS